jgi:hypothetical protein
MNAYRTMSYPTIPLINLKKAGLALSAARKGIESVVMANEASNSKAKKINPESFTLPAGDVKIKAHGLKLNLIQEQNGLTIAIDRFAVMMPVTGNRFFPSGFFNRVI